MTTSFNGTIDLEVQAETSLAGHDERRLWRLVPFVLEREKQEGDWSVTVVLVEDATLQDLHRRFMGMDEVTDVMTFPFDGDVAGGDIVVSVQRAAEQAASYDHTPEREIAFLVVHGLLHLCGWDDRDDGQRAAMLARQAELLMSFDATFSAVADADDPDCSHRSDPTGDRSGRCREPFIPARPTATA